MATSNPFQLAGEGQDTIGLAGTIYAESAAADRWLDLLNDHLDETGHTIAVDDDHGAYCGTCGKARP